MLNKKLLCALATLLTIAAPAQAAETGDGASTTIRLQAHVPVICRVELSTPVGSLDEDVISLGIAKEFCNAPQGYRLLIKHAENLKGAAVISGGKRIPLSPDGETLLRHSNRADFRMTDLVIDPGEARGALQTISMRIEPNG